MTNHQHSAQSGCRQQEGKCSGRHWAIQDRPKDLSGTCSPNPSSMQSADISALSARSHLRQLPRTESDEHLRADKAGSVCFGMVKLKVPHSGEEADPLWDPSLQESLGQSAPTTTLYGIYLHQQHQPAKRPPCQSHQKSMKAQCPQNPAPQNPSVLHLIK